MGSEPVFMRIKSYFAGSVERAIAEARHELGSEATVLTSRRSAPECRHMGAYEVVFGITEASATPVASTASADLNAELSLLRDQLDGIKRLLKVTAPGVSPYPQAEINQLYGHWVSAGFDEKWARRIAEDAWAAYQNLPPGERSSSEALYRVAEECITNKLQFRTPFEPAVEASNRAIILVGPPGSGKTTTLAKIAIKECLAKRLSLRIISADFHRAAAHEKLRTYAAILGVGFTAAGTVAEFQEAIQEYRNKHVLLIDTPGYGRRDWGSARNLTTALAELNHKEVHLVLPASMKASDLLSYIDLYKELEPEFLLFTKLDETDTYGSAIAVALETNKPLSLLTNGQSIPEDLEAASSSALLKNLFQPERSKATTAA